MPNPRQRKAYQRMISGIKFANFHNKKLILIILTSQTADLQQITYDFTKFIKRMRRLYESFEYFAVREFKAGKYHIHLLVRSSFIPQEILKAVWYETSGYSIVYVRDVYSPNIAGYLIKDLYKDMTSYGYSRGWVYPGFIRDWERCKRRADTLVEAILDFEQILKEYGVQKTLAIAQT